MIVPPILQKFFDRSRYKSLQECLFHPYSDRHGTLNNTAAEHTHTNMPTGASPSPLPGEGLVQSADLDRSFVHGIAWTGAAKWSSQLITWAATIFVARILRPIDYGIVSLASVYLGLLSVISEFGVATAVVALRDLTEQQVEQLNGLAVLLSVAAFLLSCIAARPMEVFFSSPQLAPVVIALGSILVINGFQAVPAALLQKELRFKSLSLIDAAKIWSLSVATVLLAMAGFRYWTLVLGALFSAFISTAILLTRRRSRLAWPKWTVLAPAVRMSFNVIVARLAWYAYSNADFVVAGRVLGQSVLGVYTMGWQLANAPLDKIASLIGNVTPAYFSAVQNDNAALRRYVLKLTQAISLMTFPLMIGIALVTRDGVLLTLGPKWIDLIPVLRLLAIYGCVRSIMPLLPQVLFVTGESRFTMWNSVVSAIVLPIAFIAGSRWGATGIAAAWVCAYPVNALPLLWRVTRRIGLTFGQYLDAVRPAIQSTLVMAAAVLMLKPIVASYPAAIRLVAEIVAGALTYFGFGWVFHRGRLLSFAQAFRLMRT